MTSAEYHASGAVSKSVLDMIHRSPAYYAYCKEHPREQTESMLLGSVFHKLVLEPDTFAAEFAVAPECDRRTKDGKAAWTEFQDALGDGVTPIAAQTYVTALCMRDAVRAHEIASRLLTDGKAEESYFWERDGIKCSCRPDWLKDNGLCIDLKSTQNASPDAFTRDAYNFRYYVQAWWYVDGLKRRGIQAEDFIFIACENKPPFHVCVYAADDLYFKLGEEEALADFAKYKECLETGEFYGYDKSPEVHSLSLPDYVARHIKL